MEEGERVRSGWSGWWVLGVGGKWVYVCARVSGEGYNTWLVGLCGKGLKEARRDQGGGYLGEMRDDLQMYGSLVFVTAPPNVIFPHTFNYHTPLGMRAGYFVKFAHLQTVHKKSMFRLFCNFFAPSRQRQGASNANSAKKDRDVSGGRVSVGVNAQQSATTTTTSLVS